MSESKNPEKKFLLSSLAFTAKLTAVVFLSVLLSFYLVMTSAPCNCEQEHDTFFMLPYILVLGPFNVLWLINRTGWSAAFFVAPAFLCVMYALLLRLPKPRRIANIVSLIHVVPSVITLLCVASGKTCYTLFRYEELDGLDVVLLIILSVILFIIIRILASIRKASLNNQTDRCEKGGCKT